PRTSRSSILAPRKPARAASGAGKRRKLGATNELALNTVSVSDKTGHHKPASESGRGEGGASMARPAVLTVADTITKSFLLAVETRGDRPAIREKKFGIWQPTSWREWLQISKDIAYALHAVGFKPGEVASIISNAVPEWVFADMGVLCAG